MNVLLVNKFLYLNGGSETYMIKLGEYLRTQGHKVQYFGMNHEKRCVGNQVNAYTKEVDYYCNSRLKQIVYAAKAIYSIEARRKIRRVLDDFRPDVVHLNNFNYQLTPSIILEIKKYEKDTKQEVKIVYTAHDYQLLCPNHMMNNPATKKNCEKCIGGNYFNCIKGKCIHQSLLKSVIGGVEAFYWNKRKIYQYIDTIVCCSNFMKNKMDLNPLYKNKTIVLRNFVNDIEEKKIEKKKIEKKGYVLYFGRVSREKGIETLVNVAKKLPNISFVFAGIGPLKNEIEGAHNIKNVGFVQGDSLIKIIQEANFSVYPSEWYENCPFSVMESLVYGTPVIGARIGGIPELINENRTGLLFESGNEDELYRKIWMLWNDLELQERFRRNCDSVDFDLITKYGDKMIQIYLN